MAKQKTAFITGINGQDGAWLSKLLIDKGYKVYGGVRRNSQPNMIRLRYVGTADKIIPIEFELNDYTNVISIIRDNQFDEIYNLAAQSFVATSFKQPIYTVDCDFIGPLYILEGIRHFSPKTKFYQASTSEMYGKAQEIPQNESTPFYPRSPYGVAKLGAHWMTINYRESFKIFGCCGILFNHESELRGEEFVTKKVTQNAANWANKKGKVLEIGNMESKRDWGYAKDYVEGMYMMMQAKKPDVYVLATNKTTTIRSFIKLAFKTVGREIKWEGKGVNEIGYDKKTNELLVKVNPIFFRPAEVELLIGDALKAEKELGWKSKTSLEEMVTIMVEHDIKQVDNSL